MQAVARVRDELPGWEVSWDGRTRILRARQPGSGGLVVEGRTSEDVVERARALVRVQEVARVALGGATRAAALLSSDRWPETRRRLATLAGEPEAPATLPRAGLSPAVAARTTREPSKPPRPATHAPTQQSAVQTIRTAQAKGFTGIPCDACGSVNTLRSGTCLKCADCNHAGGCG